MRHAGEVTKVAKTLAEMNLLGVGPTGKLVNTIAVTIGTNTDELRVVD